MKLRIRIRRNVDFADPSTMETIDGALAALAYSGRTGNIVFNQSALNTALRTAFASGPFTDLTTTTMGLFQIIQRIAGTNTWTNLDFKLLQLRITTSLDYSVGGGYQGAARFFPDTVQLRGTRQYTNGQFLFAGKALWPRIEHNISTAVRTQPVTYTGAFNGDTPITANGAIVSDPVFSPLGQSPGGNNSVDALTSTVVYDLTQLSTNCLGLWSSPKVIVPSDYLAASGVTTGRVRPRILWDFVVEIPDSINRGNNASDDTYFVTQNFPQNVRAQYDSNASVPVFYDEGTPAFAFAANTYVPFSRVNPATGIAFSNGSVGATNWAMRKNINVATPVFTLFSGFNVFNRIWINPL